MQDDHPSLEMLARWLAGELAHEQVVRELAPHFLGSCPVCRELRQEIDRLLAESGHWDEAVAVVETREAPELLGLLGAGPHAERMRRADEVEELHTWGVCQLLLKKVREQVFSDPVQAVETAHLAVRLAGHLGSAYHPDWVLELRARAFAHLGNARRVHGELKAADDALLFADECLAASGLQNPLVEAEVMSFKASLRLDQGRLVEALNLVDRALPLCEHAGDVNGICRTLLQKSKILTTMGLNDLAIDALRTSTQGLDREQDRRLFAYAHQGLVGSLVLAGRYEEAERLIPEVKELFGTTAEPLDWLRLRWIEANIAQGLGRLGEADPEYRALQREFLTLGNGLDAALVSLDLATLLWEQGRTAELKQLAEEVLLVFESREVHRQAVAALLLFQQACKEDRITSGMLRQIAAQLRREQRT
jgi:tetratricopeptide (TPR) repeat protein